MTEDYIEDLGDEEEGEGGEQEESSDSSKDSATVNYGKVSRAIAEIQQEGTTVAPPAINRAQNDFYPDIENNKILFSLIAVTGVNPELASRIISARPFTSLTDFVDRINPTKVQMINMIKGGCFDELYPPETYRKHIMHEYVTLVTSRETKLKEKLTMANFDKLVEFDLIPSSLEFCRRVWRYKRYMEQNCLEKEKKRYILDAPNTLKFFNNFYAEQLTLGKDYDTIPSGYIVKSAAFTRVTNKYLEELKTWLASPEACKLFFEAEQKQKYDDLWNKYCQGTVSHWEMQSLHYYYHEHELAHVNTSMYHIVDFDDLPEELKPIGTKPGRNGEEYPVYDVKAICGTVINSDNNKHIVTLLTNYGKVVDVKFYAGSYIYYNKVLSVLDEKGVKHRIEGSWFDKGGLLLISGVRRDLSFLPKTNWSKGFKHPVQLITRVNQDGTLELKEDREKL